MTKTELQKMISEEVQKEVKRIIPKLVKPLVQEAVAGALANLLAEGIVKGPPARAVREEIDLDEISTTLSESRTFDSTARQSLAKKMGYESIDAVGMPGMPAIPTNTSQNDKPVEVASGLPPVRLKGLESVLAETVMDARRGAWATTDMGAGS